MWCVLTDTGVGYVFFGETRLASADVTAWDVVALLAGLAWAL